MGGQTPAPAPLWPTFVRGTALAKSGFAERLQQVAPRALHGSHGGQIEVQSSAGGGVKVGMRRLLKEITAQQEIRRTGRPRRGGSRTEGAVFPADITFRRQRCQQGTGIGAAAAFGFDKHACQPGWCRQRQHAPPDGRQRSALIAERTELGQQPLRPPHGGVSRLIEPTEPTGVSEAPGPEFEDRCGQIEA